MNTTINPYIIPGLKSIQPSLSVKQVRNTIIDVMNCGEEVFSTTWRKRNGVYARYLFCYFIRKYIPKITQQEVADLINRDRTIVPHAIIQINAWLETNDPLITPWFNQINEQLKTHKQI